MKIELKKLGRVSYCFSGSIRKIEVSSLHFDIDKKTLIVTGLQTVEIHRRKGYAKKLLRYLNKHNLTKDKKHHLVTEVDNYSAQALYESEGFIEQNKGKLWVFYERLPQET